MQACTAVFVTLAEAAMLMPQQSAAPRSHAASPRGDECSVKAAMRHAPLPAPSLQRFARPVVAMRGHALGSRLTTCALVGSIPAGCRRQSLLRPMPTCDKVTTAKIRTRVRLPASSFDQAGQNDIAQCSVHKRACGPIGTKFARVAPPLSIKIGIAVSAPLACTYGWLRKLTSLHLAAAFPNRLR